MLRPIFILMHHVFPHDRPCPDFSILHFYLFSFKVPKPPAEEVFLATCHPVSLLLCILHREDEAKAK